MSFSKLSNYLEGKKQQYLSRSPVNKPQVVEILNKHIKEKFSLPTAIEEHQIVIQGTKVKITHLSGTVKQFLHPYREEIKNHINIELGSEGKITSLLLL